MDPQFTAPFGPAASRQDGHRGHRPSGIELQNRQTAPDRQHAHARRRLNNNRAIIENPLAHLTDEELQEDVAEFTKNVLPRVTSDKMLRAARVAKDIRAYDDVARSNAPNAGQGLPVHLTAEEKAALKSERDSVLDKGMLSVILTVSLAAFLQGHVQSSINGATLFPEFINLYDTTKETSSEAWLFGLANSAPFFFAALLGTPLSLPLNDYLGRRGAMAVAAIMIIASSLGSIGVDSWYQLFGVRVLNGIGMGIKAVSTPILASETSIGFWRGTSILAWQLWVAFGIMIGLILDLIFLQAQDQNNPKDRTSPQLMLAAPFVPALALLVALYFCPESPRYYMSPKSPRYSPPKALDMMLRLRKTELQALRDIYLVYKSVEQENYSDRRQSFANQSLVYRFTGYLIQYKELFVTRKEYSIQEEDLKGKKSPGNPRIRNALISSSTVGLAQQLCGINILAFYSSILFSGQADSVNDRNKTALAYSIGFGAVNFLFALPAVRTIDTLGRRKWLTITLLPMSIVMAAAAGIATLPSSKVHSGVLALFLYIFAALYSPGMGPIPFTLTSESFPLSHREAGCALTFTIYFLGAGALSIGFPAMINNIGQAKSLGIFACLNVVAWVLVFLLVEETKRRSLEDLDMVFAVPKTKHIRYQIGTYLPWFIQYYLLGRRDKKKPNLYIDLIWGNRISVSESEPDAAAAAGPVAPDTTSPPSNGSTHPVPLMDPQWPRRESHPPGGFRPSTSSSSSYDPIHA